MDDSFIVHNNSILDTYVSKKNLNPKYQQRNTICISRTFIRKCLGVKLINAYLVLGSRHFLKSTKGLPLQ